jgi:hypothetical protein
MFSSPVRKVPQGVTPPAQLFSVPSARGAGRVGLRAHQDVPHGRPANRHRRGAGDSPVVGRGLHDRPLATRGSRDLHHGKAMRGDLGLDHLPSFRFVLPVPAGPHQLPSVLVVHAEESAAGGAATNRKRHEPDEIVVVAELKRLLRGRLRGRVELWPVRKDWITPPEEHRVPVPRRDYDRVRVGGGD